MRIVAIVVDMIARCRADNRFAAQQTRARERDEAIADDAARNR